MGGSNDSNSVIAPADSDLPQIVTDGIQRWQERNEVDPDQPATQSELEQMERDLKEQAPNPDNYPETNDGEPLPEKEDPTSEGPSEGGDDGGQSEGGDGGGEGGG
jgi:hypothetical protein